MKRIIIYILVSIFIFLLFLEITQRIRYFYITKNKYSLFYPFNKPKEIISIKNESFFRQPFKIIQKGKGINILFIGGSSTYGVYNDNFHAFPFLLEKKMSRVSCLNAGRGASSSDNYLEVLKKCCQEFCIPEIVVFYTGYNDLFYKSIDKNIGKGFKFYNMLEKYSFLLLSARMKYVVENQLRKVKDLNYRNKFIEEFQQNIEECIKFAKNNDIKVVLMPEVVMTKKFSIGPLRDYSWYSSIYKEIPQLLQNLATKHSCTFLDPKDSLSFRWEENFIDPVHLTNTGNEVLSNFLFQNLQTILSYHKVS